jgi:DNA-binding NtrC family response regulator
VGWGSQQKRQEISRGCGFVPTELFPANPILVVDDEPTMLKVARLMLQAEGFSNVLTCGDAQEVMPLLEAHNISVLLLDLCMPGFSGEALLPDLREQYPDLPVIIVTGTKDLDIAVACMRAGARDYLVKPVEPRRLVSAVQWAIELRELHREYESYRQKTLTNRLEHPEAFDEIITCSAAMRAMFQYLETIATTRKPVLITGESGTGKELVARAIHRLSARNGAFVAENVAGLDDSAFSDTLFGHKSGAFTGADHARAGLLEEAEGGTLFLDEIGDLNPQSQVKLLRLLQEQEYRPLGADRTRTSTARLVFATNRDLPTLQHEGAFRRDLFFRLSAHQITLPPLRERTEDIPALMEHFLARAAGELNKPVPRVPREVILLLNNYSFPGNVRELEHMVFDALSYHRGATLSTRRFYEYLDNRGARISQMPIDLGPLDLSQCEDLPTLRELNEQLVREALHRAEGNQAIAARMLGITRTALNKRINKPRHIPS